MNRFERVREICGAWGLYEHSNELTQILYAVSEAGELAKSIAKNDREQAKDDVGDVLVCLINAYELSYFKVHNNIEDLLIDFTEITEMTNVDAFGAFIEHIGQKLRISGYSYGFLYELLVIIASNFKLTIDECLDQAISEIEKRKGKIVNGVFCKDA